MTHDDGVDALSEKLETCQDKNIAKEDLLRWLNLFFENKLFEIENIRNSNSYKVRSSLCLHF